MGGSEVAGSLKSPFVAVDGAFNCREFGGYPSNLSPGAVTRKGVLYRAGHLCNITSDGWKDLRSMKVATVINLTSVGEIEALGLGHPAQCDSESPKLLQLPLKQNKFSMQQLAEKYKEFRSKGPEAIAEDYLQMIQEGSAVVRDVLLSIIGAPDQGTLVHCSLGKDRTGVVFGLVMSLAGVPDDVVAEEYNLSGEALDCVVPVLVRLLRQADPSLPEEAAYEKARRSIKASKESMSLTLKLVKEKYGGVDQYVKDQCGLSEKEIGRVQRILVCEDPGSTRQSDMCRDCEDKTDS